MDKVVTLPSGAELSVKVAPFKDAKVLFQAIAKEWKGAASEQMSSPAGMNAMFMSAFSSVEVEKALWPCMLRSLYNGEKVTADCFEAENAREDFLPVCLEVISCNILPFTKGLFSGSETPSQVAVASQP